MDNNWKDRLNDEQVELEEKIDKLQEFVDNRIDEAEDQANLLRIQLKAMTTYNQCLVERISMLGDKA